MAPTSEMHSFSARLNTFHIPHQLSKRRASTQSTKKKAAGGGAGVGNTLEWPHQRPSAEDLARAGFFYQPAQESPDNVKCFFCAVKLDGWEADDDPVLEHLAHSGECFWARCLLAGHAAQNALAGQMQDGNADTGAPDQPVQDPMSEDLVAARKATFTAGASWPHEGKRGWKCKIAKMVEAGWCFDPAPPSAGADTAVGEESDNDGVSCFYCNLALDGWEPKDDPFEEHRRRSPECAFFALVEKFGGGKNAAAGKAKGKGKGGKAGGRSSTASMASRLSTLSVLETFSEPPSLADLGAAAEDDAGDGGVDDSVLSTASQVTATGTTKGKKKGGRAKAAAKGAKGRKRANTVESEADVEPLYPDLSLHAASQQTAEEEIVGLSQPAEAEQPTAAPAKKPRKGTRASKQPLDSSVVEISSLDVTAPKKATRGRKPKPQVPSEPEPEADADADHSEVSAQLQEELERSIDFDAVADDATPQPQPLPAKGKRGVKRTSDGVKKQESEDVSAFIDVFPAPPAKQTAQAKGKKGRKPSKQVADDDDDIPISESEPAPSKSTKSKKAPAKKGRKASSARSSKATIIAESTPALTEAEDLEQDEREIEAELQRIADEQQQQQRAAHQVQVEQERVGEFEPSPPHSHAQKHVDEIRLLEEELRVEVESLDGAEGKNMARFVASVAATSPPPAGTLTAKAKENATPSPNGSDKENQPSSIVHPSDKQHPAQAPLLSPTKTTRVPLAPSTPNRLNTSPSKARLGASPTKPLTAITTIVPWEAVDVDSMLFMPSPQATPGTLSQRLAAAGSVLTTPERGLTVEEWIRYRAGIGEEELRRGCEGMVVAFEREGMRALESLGGIVVAGV